MESWSVDKEGFMYKVFILKSYQKKLSFVNEIAHLSEKINHHPKIIFDYNYVSIFLLTHEKGTITEKDKNLSILIDKIYSLYLNEDK